MTTTPKTASSWWRGWRVAVAVCSAVAIGVGAFAYRFNTLGGALGGFDNDHFIYLMRTDMVLHGEQPLRDFVDAELRGAWPALTYSVSAWAQQLGGRSLLPEAYLSVGALAAAHALVFLLALDFSKRWSVALLAAAAAIASAPKLYNYPKVLMLALGAWTLRSAVVSPSVARLAAAAAVTAAATLFRHDYALYIASAIVAGLVVRDAGRWSMVGRTVGIYTALTAVCLLPSALWVQTYEGIPAYVRNAFASVAAETARTELRLPRIDLSDPLSGDSLLLVTYWAFWAMPIVATVTLIGRAAVSKGSRLTTVERATAAGLLPMAFLVDRLFLRANLAERFGDAIVPIVLLAAWAVGAAATWPAATARRAVTFVSVVLLVQLLGAAYVYADAARDLDTSGLSDSWGKAARRFEAVRGELSRLPPDRWTADDAGGVLSAARYIAECTNPDDRLLVAGPLHEILVFARRQFAAGQGMFKLSLYTSDSDQRRALERLTRQSVPIVLADARDFEDGFVSDYPLIARHLAEGYRQAGTIVVDDEPRVLVFADTHRQPRRVDSQLGLPCFR